ncbi:MAG: CYTH domain-containing protein [Lentisphaeria bacterium]|nr:CYTH domain-containing protein [Lentisphaeria bacterium]
MHLEIERKFLVKDLSWKESATSSKDFQQGYFPTGDGVTVRARIAGDKARLTIKGPINDISRAEFEYPVPLADAIAFLTDFCIKPVILKRRWYVPFGEFTWEIDEFAGKNEGLIVAEVELDAPDREFPVPPWLGREVTHESRFRNSRLVRHPFCEWTDEEKR